MIKIIEGTSHLDIYFKDKKIISHTEELPTFSIGKGSAEFDMYHGNFDITSELESKYPLKHFEVIEATENDAVIRFFYNGLCLRVALKVSEKGLLVIQPTCEDGDFNRFWIRLSSTKHEAVYGCGEQYSELNMKGKRVPLWVSEQGVGRNKKEMLTFLADKFERAGGDWYTTYFPQPSLITSPEFFCHVDDSAYMEFDFTHHDFSELECWHIPSKVVIGVEEDFIKTVQKQSEYFGLQPELPEWIFDGVMLGLQGGTDVVLPKIDHAMEKGVKISAMWIQDWEGKRITAFGKQLMWDWHFHEEMYPNLPETIKQLKEKGIRTMGYINPFLATEGKLYKEATEKDYTLKNKDGEEYLVVVTTFPVAIVDLTNPDAYNWLKEVIKTNMIDIGLSGWMADFAEYTPTDAIPFSGEDAQLLHNKFPMLWAKLNREAVEEAGKLGEVVFFMRAGYSFSQRYNTLMWSGDQMVDWSLDDGLPSVIPSALSLGMSGFGICHSDIGGYTTIANEMGTVTRSKELFMRWTEQAAFSPAMRTHEGNRPALNVQFDYDDEVIEHFAEMIRIHVKMKDYLLHLNKENAEQGLPFMRPLYMHYFDTVKSENCKLKDIKYQYLLGRDLLVCPVIEPGKTVKKVMLPEDQWINIWTGEEYGHGVYEFDVPLRRPPVFVRKDSEFKDLFLKLKEED
jgi:alpha-glucosidase